MPLKPQWLTFLVILTLSILTAGCGKEKTPTAPGARVNPGGTNPNPNPNPNPSSFSVVGTYRTGCETYNEWWYGDYGYKVKLTFTTSQVSEELIYYYDTSCSEQWGDPETASSNYTLGADVAGQASTKELNLTTGLPDVRPFQIVKVSGNDLYLGDVTSRDGQSAANRPNTISSIRYTK